MSILLYEKIQAPEQLWWRIGSLLLLVISFVLILISFLNYSNYRKNYLELNQTRYLVMAKDLRQTIESGLNIGISPAENIHLRPIMRQLAATQSATRFIGVIDENGIVVQQGEIADAAKATWKVQSQHSEEFWHTTSANTFQINMPFSNNFNLRVGIIVVAYDRPTIENALQGMLHKLAWDLLVAIALCAGFIFTGCWLLTRKLARELSQASNAITDLGNEPQRLNFGLLGEEVSAGIDVFASHSKNLTDELASLEHNSHSPSIKEAA